MNAIIDQQAQFATIPPKYKVGDRVRSCAIGVCPAFVGTVDQVLINERDDPKTGKTIVLSVCWNVRSDDGGLWCRDELDLARA